MVMVPMVIINNKVALTSQKIYEDKIKTMSYVDSSELIPLLIEVSRKKQGNELLNWGKWLEIPENKYLFQINEDMAKKVFQDTTALIKRYISNINLPTQRRELIEAGRTSRTRGGDEPTIPFNKVSLTFGVGAPTTGDDGPYVETDFNPDTYNLADKGLTVSYWVKPDVISAVSYAFGRRAGSSNERFFFGIHNDRINMGFGAHALNEAAYTHGMEVGNWYHWVVTFEGQQGDGAAHPMKIYIDGVLIYTNNWRWTQTGNTGGGENIYFGARNNNGHLTHGWKCSLDEVAIFNEEKDSDWVSSVYNYGKPNDLQNENSSFNSDDFVNIVLEHGLVGYWRFEGGDGTTVEDLSGYDNHGTLTSTDESTYGLPTFSSDVPEE